MSTPSSLQSCSPKVRSILEDCLSGAALSCNDARSLFECRGDDLRALCQSADLLRQAQAGDTVTYVLNRNINFTNVCIKTCQFCAFARGIRSEEGYFLSTDEILQKAAQAHQLGATELCLQAGLAPLSNPWFYLELCEALSDQFPDLHLHAFSPEEIQYAARLAKVSIRDYLKALKRAGLGSLPGTSAEILDDNLRRQISPGRITTADWVHVIRTAHELEIPTTSTMMFGHVESLEHRGAHMDLLRRVQADTGGFTEFVPLSFVHHEAPLFVKNKVPGVQAGPADDDIIRLYAIARLMLGPTFRNIQASWVKEGLKQSQRLLSCGVNDLGGTLMNESISTTAGATHGQLVSPARLREIIRAAGRQPVQRTTTYTTLRTFPATLNEEATKIEAREEPLNRVISQDKTFGSYSQWTHDESLHYQFERPKKVPLAERFQPATDARPNNLRVDQDQTRSPST